MNIRSKNIEYLVTEDDHLLCRDKLTGEVLFSQFPCPTYEELLASIRFGVRMYKTKQKMIDSHIARMEELELAMLN